MDRNELLAHRDEVMAEIHARIASPNRSDLCRHTYRLWEEVGAINSKLRRLDAEAAMDKAEEEGLLEEEFRGEGMEESLINDAQLLSIPDQSPEDESTDKPEEAKQRSKRSPMKEPRRDLIALAQPWPRHRTEPLGRPGFPDGVEFEKGPKLSEERHTGR